jgi:hypothetical protein
MEILCRIDPATKQPVVFITDTIHNGQIQAWKGEGKSEYVPLDYYHMTGPLSASDERVLCERFVKATNAAGLVKIRHRMPRTSRPLPNLLASLHAAAERRGFTPTVPAYASSGAAIGATPSGVTIVSTPVAAPRTTSRGNKAAKKAKGIRGRKPAAKPIESQLPPAAAPVANATVSQASPADVMAAIQALGQEFNNKLASLAGLLEAKK